MGGRPVLLQRFPNGASGKSFFQKRVPEKRPDWLATTTVSTPNGTESEALVIADIAHVVWAVNLGCLGFHVWPSKADDLDHADELRIDLDPTPGRRLRPDPRGGRRGAGRCSTSSASSASPRRAAARACTSTCGSNPGGTPTRCGRRPSRWPASSSGVDPTCSPRRGGRRSGASGSSSTSTRTRRTRRSSARGRCGPARAPRCRPRSPGTRWPPSSPTSSRSPPCPARVGAG